jgi:hypothetical protein
MRPRNGRGRPVSIPESAFAECFRLHGEGHGYRRIADLLAGQGVYTTKSSVERLIRGLPPYTGRLVSGALVRDRTHR